ncbi:hypothetical protein AB0J86_21205 [Micromonospora sp. NPDC049559]
MPSPSHARRAHRRQGPPGGAGVAAPAPDALTYALSTSSATACRIRAA